MESVFETIATRKIILFSGGIDSALLIDRALNEGFEVIALHCRYAHPANENEYKAVKDFESFWRAQGLSFQLHIQNCEMIADNMFIGAGEKGSRVVPNRNAIMLMHALNIAVSFDAQTIEYGAVLNDNRDYIDCRPDFIDKMNQISNLYNVVISAPLTNQSKADLIIPAYIKCFSWSCYEPYENNQCGKCNSCTENQVIFRNG